MVNSSSGSVEVNRSIGIFFLLRFRFRLRRWFFQFKVKYGRLHVDVLLPLLRLLDHPLRLSSILFLLPPLPFLLSLSLRLFSYLTFFLGFVLRFLTFAFRAFSLSSLLFRSSSRFRCASSLI